MNSLIITQSLQYKTNGCRIKKTIAALLGFKYRTITDQNQNKLNLKKCREILGVTEESTLKDVKDAFIKLAKKYHPDSQAHTADTEKFFLIESAFRLVKESLDGSQDISETCHVLEKDYGIKHTVPQHRKYLNLEGVGFGTPSQREKQHNRYKVTRAVENVYDYRIKKDGPVKGKETAIFKRDAAMAREYSGKTRQAIERLVEDLILESMKKGEFENLSGMGKPLKYKTENPYVDFTTQKLNEILINNGFIPEWIILEKDLKWQKENIRKELGEIRTNFKAAPLDDFETLEWENEVEKLRATTVKLNKQIDKFNMIVPILTKQQLHFQLTKEAQKVLTKEKINIKKSIDHKPINTGQDDRNNNSGKETNDGILNLLWKIMP